MLGFLSIPIGYILRVIPVPKQGFCGFNISLSFISPRKWLKYAKKRLFGNISHDFEHEHELLEDEE
jgi:hypothetical protein